MPIDPSIAFVSYAREDLDFVLRLAKDLKAKGAKVWMDKLDIRPGKRWELEVEAALNDCSRMLVIVSPTSVASKNVLAEAAYAIDEGKEVIPVLYQDCKMPFRLRPFQYADFRTDYATGLDELLTSLGSPVTDTQKELRELERRAQSGDADAMVALGGDYAMGERVEQDQALAITWFRRAAEAGNSEGMFQLGATYKNGYGVEPDVDQAIIWLRRAADKGHPFAMLELAGMYESGQGFALDYAEARKWYNRAATSRPDEAGTALERLAGKETAENANREEKEHQRLAAEQARLMEERKETEAEKARQEQLESQRKAAEKKTLQEHLARLAHDEVQGQQKVQSTLAEGEITKLGFLTNLLKWVFVAAATLGVMLLALIFYRVSWRTWKPQSSGTQQDLLAVAFVSSQAGWVTGGKGSILHTTDGGNSWQPQSSGTHQWLRSVAFVSPQVGWVAGDGGTILHTADGGTSWQAQGSGPEHGLSSVAFVSPKAGWVVGFDGTILHTADSGASWEPQTSGTQQSLSSVTFVTPQTGWVVGDGGTVLHTTDGGQTWHPQTSGTKLWLTSVAFVTPQAGWVVGQGGAMLHTTDGGQTWQASRDTRQTLLSIAFVSTRAGWSVGYNGTILHYGS